MGGATAGGGQVSRADAEGPGASPTGGERAGSPDSAPDQGNPRGRAGPNELRLDNLLLLDADDTNAVPIESVTFAEAGVGVVRSWGERSRVLPWSSVMTHVVEPWSGGVIPEWWVDPELNRRGPASVPPGSITDPRATNRPAVGRESGALIGIQTPTQTYRFLLPGGDVKELSHQITAFAVRYQGPTGASSATRVVRWGDDAERRTKVRPQKGGATWSSIQPFLVVALVVFICAAVTLILLQSAGTIHLPYLGGSASGAIGAASGRTGLLRIG